MRLDRCINEMIRYEQKGKTMLSVTGDPNSPEARAERKKEESAALLRKTLLSALVIVVLICIIYVVNNAAKHL
jgi:cell division protein FtsL